MARRFEWRKLVNARDVSDVIGLMRSGQKILARRGQQAARQFQKNVERTEGHILEDVATFADRLRTIVDRKSREFAHTRKEAAKRVSHEVEPIVENLSASAERLRETADQKTYEVAKKVVERHDKRNQDEGGAGIFVIGAVLGTLIGAIAAIWFAPQSGEETRREIEHAAEDVIHRVEGESIEDSLQAGREEARRFQRTEVR
jgi:gas vesicle protein